MSYDQNAYQEPQPQSWQQPQQPYGPGQQPYAPAQPSHVHGQPSYPGPQPFSPQSQYAMQHYPAPAIAVHRKDPVLALVLSIFFPGVGTILNGETGKGVGILVGYIACALLFWLIVPIAGMLALWIWGLVDAYQGAERYNAAHGLY